MVNTQIEDLLSSEWIRSAVSEADIITIDPDEERGCPWTFLSAIESSFVCKDINISNRNITVAESYNYIKEGIPEQVFDVSRDRILAAVSRKHIPAMEDMSRNLVVIRFTSNKLKDVISIIDRTSKDKFDVSAISVNDEMKEILEGKADVHDEDPMAMD